MSDNRQELIDLQNETIAQLRQQLHDDMKKTTNVIRSQNEVVKDYTELFRAITPALAALVHRYDDPEARAIHEAVSAFAARMELMRKVSDLPPGIEQ